MRLYAARLSPAWARKLVRRFLREHGDLHPEVELRWRRHGTHEFSNGWTCYEISDEEPVLLVIAVSAGSDTYDQRWCLLHELAHILVGSEARHSRVFYAQLLSLCESGKYGITPGYAIWREASSRSMLSTAEGMGYRRLAARMRQIRDSIDYYECNPSDFRRHTEGHRLSRSRQ